MTVLKRVYLLVEEVNGLSPLQKLIFMEVTFLFSYLSSATIGSFSNDDGDSGDEAG